LPEVGELSATLFIELTSDGSTVTPAVHYLRFGFSAAHVEALGDPTGEVALVADHAHCQARSVLPESVREELVGDLRGTTKPLPIG
jgi:hypothetical protein